MPTKSKNVFREAKENAYSPPQSYIDTSVPDETQHEHHVIHNGKVIGKVKTRHYHQYGDYPTASSELTFTNDKGNEQTYYPPNVGLYGNDKEGSDFKKPGKVADALQDHLNNSKRIPAYLKKLRESGPFEVRNTEPELPLNLPHVARNMGESVTELLRLAINEKPNAFREVFDEIMLAKIVDISDEMKDEISQSMFGESSHEYGKKKKKHDKKKMEESFEPDEDEDEDDVGDEDEDFDISDEDLEDLDLDDLDFEEDEEQIEESNAKRWLDQKTNGRPYGDLSKEQLATLNAEYKENQRGKSPESIAAAQKEIVGRFVNGTENVKNQIAAMKARLKQDGLTFPQDEK
jgi:hypothetical protein